MNLMEKKLHEDCAKVKDLMERHNSAEAKKVIFQLMEKYPDSAIPHNLYGIVLAYIGEYASAAAHFRAAYELEPYYLPPRENLELLGNLNDGKGKVRKMIYWNQEGK